MNKIILGIFTFVLIFVLFLLNNGVYASWRMNVIKDLAKFQYETRSIAVDSKGNPHIVYGGEKLFYAYFNGSDWQYETIESVYSYSNSIVIDKSDNLHVMFHDGDNDYLKYATNTSGTWVSKSIDSSGIVVGVSPEAVALDSEGYLHAVYSSYDSTKNYNEIKYANNVNGSWNFTTLEIDGKDVPTSFTNTVSLASDSSNNLHLIYTENGSGPLKHATNASGYWISETIGNDSASFVSMNMDSDDAIHIGYYDYVNRILKYANNASGSWVSETITTTPAFYFSLGIDSNDGVHVSYQSETGVIEYAVRSGSSWSIEVIDNGSDTSTYSSPLGMGLDNLDQAHIVFFDGNNQSLKYALQDAQGWNITQVDLSREISLSSDSLIIDHLNNPHVIYGEHTDSGSDAKQQYASNTGDSWTIDTVVSSSQSTSEYAAGIDSNGDVHLAYIMNNSLMYAKNTDGVWALSSIDTMESNDRFVALFIDASDHIYIYYSSDDYLTDSDSLLKQATNATGSWVLGTFDFNEPVSSFLSMINDSSDNVHILYSVYSNYSSSELKYANNISGSFKSTVIDTVSRQSKGPAVTASLALDASNNAHVSYFQLAGYYVYDLKYATNSSGLWTSTTIEDSIVGIHSSLGVDSDNHVQIVYGADGNLTYATNETGNWSSFIIDGGVASISNLVIDASDNLHILYSGSFSLKYVKKEPATQNNFILSVVNEKTIGAGLYNQGSGIVSSSYSGLTFSSTFSQILEKDTEVTLTATPGESSVFKGWEGGGCDGTEPCTVKMSSDIQVKAIFESQAQKLDNGYLLIPGLLTRSVIKTENSGDIKGVWKQISRGYTASNDLVISGYFHADPADVSWGNPDNPDLFVKVWVDHGGRTDVNFLHVSVPQIVVYSDYTNDDNTEQQSTTTMTTRYHRHYYENGYSYTAQQNEDGIEASGYSQVNTPTSYFTINDLNIGAAIQTVEKGPVSAVWKLGGTDTTSAGDQVVWGYFHADSGDVSWGSSSNPDLFVKIWFDHSGRIDANFFHVSVPDIEVYSDYVSDGIYDSKGTTIMDDRYIRHEYTKQ